MKQIVFCLVTIALMHNKSLMADAWDLKNTVGVVVGVLEWKDSSLSPFSNHLRKDKELHALLKKRGAKNIQLLIDAQATRKNIEAAIRKSATTATADSTFYFYYAGHGIQDNTGAYIANADIDTNRTSATGLSMRTIAELIAKNFRGQRVILTGDFCFSGAFEQVVKILAAQGKQVIVLTSATASNISTGNWTYTQTWLDCLAGSPFCDRNGDGTITLGEANTEIGEAMKFRERQRNGFALSNANADWVIADSTGAKPEGAGDFVLAPFDKGLNAARVIEREGDSVRTEFFFYSEKKFATMPMGKTQAFNFRREKPGSAIRVLWNGKGYDAKVLKEEGGFHYITYPGYDAVWNEWVMDNRILSPDSVLIEWQGKWYPGKALERKGKQTRVHYDGFGDEWNEWVPASRLKIP
ncbi:MAG: caspase family protein [Spirochaetes bacterium]|nr:caspase family protein [Spirochaetota bacterium]